MQKKDIHILVIPSWYPPFGGTFFREHSLALQVSPAGVAVLAPLETGVSSHPREFIAGRWRQRSIGHEGLREITSIFRRIPMADRLNCQRWIARAESMYATYARQHGHPDLIQAHSAMWGGLAAARIKKRWGIPYVITEHRGRFTPQGAKAHGLIRPWHRPLLKEAFSGASHIVTVTSCMQEVIGSLCPETRLPFSVIPNMTDTGFFTPRSQREEQAGPFTFLCIAHLEIIKGVDVLLNAFARARPSLPPATRLVIGGDGPQREALKTLCISLGLSGQAEFLGRLSRSQVLSALHQANALVVPSHFEAFGVVIIEAMSAGLPVIATDSGGPADIVTPDTGILVAPGNPGQLALAMEQMVQQHEQYKADAIRRYARARFSKEVVAGHYLALYKSLLAHKFQ